MHSSIEKRREYHKEWKRKNPRYAGRISRERKAILIEYKGGRCTDCLGMFPNCVYQFDHLRDKEFEIGHCLTYSMRRLLAEADKCELVCANCHAIRTAKRLEGKWPASKV